MAPEGPPQEPSDSGAVPAPTKPPANPYQGVFYDNDFSFLEGPSTAERHFGYSHLWPGAFLFDTPGGAGGRDFYYTQFTATF